MMEKIFPEVNSYGLDRLFSNICSCALSLFYLISTWSSEPRE